MKTRYDVVILGGGHNGLVSAAYLARAGLSVLVLEQKDHFGGAAISARIFPDYDARLSRYAYLVSLFPEKIIRELGLQVELRQRTVASFTPFVQNGRHSGLLLSNVSEEISRRSTAELTGSESEFDQLTKLIALARLFAEKIWHSLLEPLASKEEWQGRFDADESHRVVWRGLVEEPLGRLVERYLSDDLMRGVVFTDATIGLLTHPHDESLLQNRCFLYHVIGNKTGEWKVPVSGMGRISAELERVAREAGAELVTSARVQSLGLGSDVQSVVFDLRDQREMVDARFVLANVGENILASLLGETFEPDSSHDGSVFKVNLLLRRLPRLKAGKVAPTDAFRGTFHIDEGYEQMKQAYAEAARGELPARPPSEVYCHTLTDDTVLSPELRAQGFHTLTLFGLYAPWRLFAIDNDAVRARALERYLAGLNHWLAEPIEDCLARDRDGHPCIECKSPVDIETELGHYRGNIFHRALQFPFAESDGEINTWGVETRWPNVLLCGASARRGGGVSGIPGHNAAMKVLEVIRAHRSGAGTGSTRLGESPHEPSL